MLSELAFGSLLAYSPNGAPGVEPGHSSRRFVAALKNDSVYRNEPAVELAVRRLCEERPAALDTMFGAHVVLVPVPGSAPFPSRDLDIPLRGTMQDFLWVPRRICEALVESGLAVTWQPLVVRRERVPRSSAVPPADRPLPQRHFDSLGLANQLPRGSRLIVVDDVVTRGSTLLACASRLHHAYPDAQVEGFALVRTISNPLEFQKILDPVRGSIRLRAKGDTIREP